MYIPFHQKYRPAKFSDLVGQAPIAQTLSNAIKRERVAPAYLFYGPRGCGKTSTARIFAAALNCSNRVNGAEPCGLCFSCTEALKQASLDIIEIDAASNSGVENATKLIEKLHYAPISGKYKVIIIDEVHMLTREAFNSLLKTIEEPPAYAVFILATTELHKVKESVASRCQHFSFKRVNSDTMVQHLSAISKTENIDIKSKALEIIATFSDGCLRDALCMLDQAQSFRAGAITPDDIYELTGKVSKELLQKVYNLVVTNNQTELLTTLRFLAFEGKEPETIVNQFAKFITDQLIAEPDQTNKLMRISDYLLEIQKQLKSTVNPQIWLEVGFLKLLDSTKTSSKVVAVASTPEVTMPVTPLLEIEEAPWKTWKSYDDAIKWGHSKLPAKSITEVSTMWNNLLAVNGKKAVAWVELIRGEMNEQ